MERHGLEDFPQLLPLRSVLTGASLHEENDAHRADGHHLESVPDTDQHDEVKPSWAAVHNDPNRRLCNQALFKAIYIDEDNDVRVGYRNPYDGLSLSGLHADALSWAAEAKKQGQARTSTKGGPLVASSHLTRLG